ncbi:carboxypeptidase [bacterium M21]|nr:carboxypeptidase [bacterium M21]
MTDALRELKQRIGEITDLNRAAAVLGWDQQTYMPAGGAVERANQISTLSRLSHEALVAPRTGELLATLSDQVDELCTDSDDACLVHYLQHKYEKTVKVPVEHVTEFSRLTALAQHAWEEAKDANDFATFQPHLRKIIQMRQEYASFFADAEHVYDPLLDDFERGLTTRQLRKIFGELRPLQVDLLQRIRAAKQVDNDFLFLNYDEDKQWDFGVEVIRKFGYDFKSGRQDRSIHPFTTSFAIDDVRITTRLNANDLQPGLFGTMHEAGHALYEMGISRSLERTPLAQGCSLGIHESQSRLWENIIGRSMDFWTHFYPQLKKAFPSQLGTVGLTDFYNGINRVESSLVRVEADEATYNLHVMLRLELEIALMEGSLDVVDLPEAWDLKMEEYLGIRPTTAGEGVLQDVHWSCGLFGYFPTYALGNLVAAQLWDCMNLDLPDLSSSIRVGEFAPLLDWLRTKFHRHGAKFTPQDLLKRVTGGGISCRPYMNYLETKYSAIYGL